MKRNAIEWAVLLASAAGIVLVVAVLVAEGLSPATPANPTVELRLAEARSGALGWIMPATVANDGDEAAEVVVIEAEATVAGELETSEAVIDYLPAGSRTEVAFGFSSRPEGTISTRLVSFQVP